MGLSQTKSPVLRKIQHYVRKSEAPNFSDTLHGEQHNKLWGKNHPLPHLIVFGHSPSSRNNG